MVINCGSLGKTGEFLAAAEYINPECILGSESWLDNFITNSGVFPPNYNIYIYIKIETVM